MRLAADGPRDVVSRVFRPTQAPNQAAGRLQQAPGDADGVGLEPRHAAVAALVAVKLELVALVGGEVVVVGDELNHGAHGGARKDDASKSSAVG